MIGKKQFIRFTFDALRDCFQFVDGIWGQIGFLVIAVSFSLLPLLVLVKLFVPPAMEH